MAYIWEVNFRSIRFVIGLVALALLSLIAVQLYWVKRTYALREEKINQKATELLNKTCFTFEKNLTCLEMFSRILVKPGEGFSLIKQHWKGNEEFIPATVERPDTVAMYYMFERDTLLQKGNKMVFINPFAVDVFYRFELLRRDSTRILNRHPDLTQLTDLHANNFRDKIAGEKPIEQKLDIKRLVAELKKALQTAQLPDSFHYAFINEARDSIEFAGPGTDRDKIGQSSMQARLFGESYYSKPYLFRIYLDQESGVIFRTLWGILLSSALVIGILIYAFWYFVSIIFRQKKLSLMKTDFINNMTHEFKTPVTNIALALETLDEAEVHGDSRTSWFHSIIREENNRLKENVERILQIAMVENGELQLQPSFIDIHMLLDGVIANFEIQAANRNAKVHKEFHAEKSEVNADLGHLTNVFNNLLDNALKYSLDKPVITVSTANTAGGLLIKVKDKGIGMTPATLKRIFESFYRAHTGNVHNVKGFGLGLSYVKTIVEAHKGSVDVQSEPGKGSVFSIFIPFDSQNYSQP